MYFLSLKHVNLTKEQSTLIIKKHFKIMLNEKQKKKLEVLNRRKRQLEKSKECVLKSLRPILEDLEKIRISIDEIEIENKYGS